jgi:hypothetical protein
VVAEKFEAMVKLGMANSRMKDFYDLLVLAQRFEFQSATLATAIQATAVVIFMDGAEILQHPRNGRIVLAFSCR